MSASLSFHGDARTRVRVISPPGKSPFLIFDEESHWLTVSGFDRMPVADHLAFAQSLATAGAEYLAAVKAYAATLPDAPATH